MTSRREESNGRKYAASACLSCKRRKVRCDNGKPRCSNCNLYNVDCVFGTDQRRTSSTLKAISTLKDKVHQLEEQLRQAQTTAQSSALSGNKSTLQSTPETQHQQGPIEDNTGLDHVVAANNQQNAFRTDSLMMDDPLILSPLSPIASTHTSFPWQSDSPGLQWNGAFDLLIDPDRPLSLNQGVSNYSPETFVPAGDFLNFQMTNSTLQGRVNVLETTSPEGSNSSEDDLTLRLATTSGGLSRGQDGRRHYYGASSSLRIVRDSLLSLYQPTLPPARSHGVDKIKQAGLEWQGDEQLEAHLSKLFFTWHNPLINEVDEDTYRREERTWHDGSDTPLFSPALKNSILAMGALYSSRQHSAVSGELSEFFDARARIYVETEMDSPSLATAQAIVVLAAYETCNCRDSRAWLYAGMAVQLITDLGLHVDVQRGNEDEEPDSDTQAVDRIRNQLFWVVWMVDCYHGSYNGRPSLMSNMKVHVPPPVPSSCSSWEPYMDEESRSYSGFDIAVVRELPVYVSQLASKLGKILEVLYTPIPGSTEEVRPFVAEMADDLANWRASLPQELRLDQAAEGDGNAPLPFVILLHLLLSEAVIFLYRPFLMSNDLWGTGLTASQICSNSAVEICRLMGVYQRYYPLRYINCTAIRIVIAAGTIHAYDSCIHSGPRAKEAQQNFMVAVRLLGELSLTFNSATRGLEIITALRSEWQAQRFQGLWAKKRTTSGTYQQS